MLLDPFRKDPNPGSISSRALERASTKEKPWSSHRRNLILKEGGSCINMDPAFFSSSL